MPSFDRDHPRYKWVALSNTTLGMLLATVNASIVIISLPAIFNGIHLEPLGNGLVRVSWPRPETGVTLYHSTTLTGWAPLPPPYTTNADHLCVIRSEHAEFFFLRPQ